MEGKSHRIGGVVAMLGTYEYLRVTGGLIQDIHPLVQLAVMYPASSFGAQFPDLDHHKGSIPIKTPAGDFAHKILHLTKPKHRSWQTHSILVTGGAIALLLSLVNLWEVYGGANLVEIMIVKLILYGFLIGVASHLVLDVLTPKGIWLIPGFRIRLVPKSSFFSTGNTWEVKICRNIMYGISYILVLLIFLNIIGFDLTDITYKYITTDLFG